MGKNIGGKLRKQVAALPVARGPHGAPQILLITSRETKRFIVPKGWSMKGVKDRRAAEIEAQEEAGLIGRAHRKPIGSFLAWKRHASSFELVRTKVFLFLVEGQLPTWKEKGQRRLAWLDVEQAAALLDEPGLVQVVLDLASHLPKSWRLQAESPPVEADVADRQGNAKPASA